MKTVSDAPTGGQRSAPSAPLDFRDAAQVRAWLAQLRDAVNDGAAAGEDATRRPKKRMFSRFEAKRRVREASQGALALLEAAERGLSLAA